MSIDTARIKKYAIGARRDFIHAVGMSAAKFGILPKGSQAPEFKNEVAIINGVAYEVSVGRQVNGIIAKIAATSYEEVIEAVAYTWFNRFIAIRYMEIHGLLQHGMNVLAPEAGRNLQDPEILGSAANADLPGLDRTAVLELTAEANSDEKLYRRIILAQCVDLHRSLPFLFEKIGADDELLLPDNLLSPKGIIKALVAASDSDEWQEVEVIGWLYQFYVSEKKDLVFAGLKANKKITAENIPAATQLFTPHWIVRYLVENSLGRLWLLNRPKSLLAEKMEYYIAPETPETDFPRISRPEEIRMCDPAAGSGHILTYGFDLLYAIYEEEGYDPNEIPGLIFANNLAGIEIDDRAGALAAFALAMKAAAKLGRRQFLQMETKPNIVVLQNATFEDPEMQLVRSVVGKDLFTDELRETLGQFEQAKNFGSLIVPKLRDPAKSLRVVEARNFGGDLLLKEVQERIIAVLRMAEALSPKYHVVVANPPYMGGKNMDHKLQGFAKSNFPDSKSDLFAMFIERSGGFLLQRGLSAMITMQSWMFLSSYEKLRSKHIDDNPIISMAHIGTRGFDSIGGDVVSTTAFVLLKSAQKNVSGDFISLLQGRNETEKSEQLRSATSIGSAIRFQATPSKIASIPGRPIAYWTSEPIVTAFYNETPLGEIIKPRQGLATGNNDRFLRGWAELSIKEIGFNLPNRQDAANSSMKWFPYNKGGDWRKWYGNFEFVVNWEDDGREIRKFTDENGKLRSRPQNTEYYFKEGVTWADITTSSFAARYAPAGSIFDVKGSSGFPSQQHLHTCLALLNSGLMTEFMSILNPTATFQVGDMARIPFSSSIERADKISENSRKLLQFGKSDWDAYETSWDFATLPLLQLDHRAETLEATYTALRTHWQGMTNEMQRLEEENNRIFIDAYGLQEELTPEVPLNEITLTCNPAYRYGTKNDVEANETRLRADTVAEFVSYGIGCMMGRYSLDHAGLAFADAGGIGFDPSKYETFPADGDGIIPITDDEWFVDDAATRFRTFLAAKFGADKLQENLIFVAEALKPQGNDTPDEKFRSYISRAFFKDHRRRYKNRPIYWLFSSGKTRAFEALVYLHRYNADTLAVMRTDYVIPLQTKMSNRIETLEHEANGTSVSAARRSATTKSLATLRAQKLELQEFDERLQTLAEHRIEIDLDDGVKANYALFEDILFEPNVVTGKKKTKA